VDGAAGYWFVIWSGAFVALVLAMIGGAGAWILARAMDWSNRRRRHKPGAIPWLAKINEDPVALAIYYGARWIGICLLVGWLFSRPV